MVIGARVVGGTGHQEIHAIVRLADDSYVVGGYAAKEADGGNWAWLVAFEARDDKRWSATYGGNNRASHAHGLLAVGYARSPNHAAPAPQRDLWLYRASIDGQLQLASDSGLVTVNAPFAGDAARTSYAPSLP